MKKSFILSLMLSLAFTTLAQDEGKFSFEFGYGIGQVAMCKLNQFYIDSLGKPLGLFNANITTTNHGFVSVRYQPFNPFDIGLYGNIQQAELKGNPIFYSSDEIGNTSANHGTSHLLLQSVGYGITTNIHINHILKWHQKESKFLNRSRLLTEFRVGNSFSNATINVQYPTLPIASSYVRYHAQNIEGQAALKFEYDYLKRSVINGIGLKIGYNYLNTKTLRNSFNETWKVLNDKTINLDFSGWFASVYLVFAK
jgi:hypothetical protein